ncbi:hypothetical protein V6Z11_A08G250600 [Gossypium hirsutum]
MKIALLAKNKLGFVDGTYSKDSLPDEMGYQWEPCNVIVLSWILNTVSKELSARIIFASSVAVVWNDLSERLHKIDGSRIYFLHREIISHFQGGDTYGGLNKNASKKFPLFAMFFPASIAMAAPRE